MDIDKILRDLRTKIRAEQKEESTADAYCNWTRRFLKYCQASKLSKGNCSAEQAVTQFLSMLANDQDVSANTQNQAFSALCYLYAKVFERPLVGVSALRAKRPDTIREVLDQSELIELFDQLSGRAALVARMMYASSFRIGETVAIRIKDISFERCQIAIRGAKGQKDRMVGFPPILHDPVRLQIESMRVLWKHDMADGLNGVSLPKAYGRKNPSAHKQFACWYLFASDHYSRAPISGHLLRHHQDSGHLGRQISEAAQRCGFDKRVTSHCLRHSFATHSIENGVPIHVVQKIMGHTDIRTTERYLHMAKDGVTAAKSPLEDLLRHPEAVAEMRAESERPFKLRVVG
jgi:integron integrase